MHKLTKIEKQALKDLEVEFFQRYQLKNVSKNQKIVRMLCHLAVNHIVGAQGCKNDYKTAKKYFKKALLIDSQVKNEYPTALALVGF